MPRENTDDKNNIGLDRFHLFYQVVTNLIRPIIPDASMLIVLGPGVSFDVIQRCAVQVLIASILLASLGSLLLALGRRRRRTT